MPVDWSRYPANWKTEVVPRIRARSGDRCEWCGVANKETGFRTEDGKFHSVATPPGVPNSFLQAGGLTRIILTTAHLGTAHPDGRPGDKHDKMDCRDENLAHLCQRCHLLYDLPEHMANARKTRDRKAGRISLFEVAGAGAAPTEGGEAR